MKQHSETDNAYMLENIYPTLPGSIHFRFAIICPKGTGFKRYKQGVYDNGIFHSEKKIYTIPVPGSLQTCNQHLSKKKYKEETIQKIDTKTIQFLRRKGDTTYLH